MNRRDWFRLGAIGLKGLIGLVLAVPGAAYLLSPLRKRREDTTDFRRLARLGDLEIGRPRSFSIVDEQRDAWVTYPATPIGTVWLVRQPEGAEQPVLALSAECPHLACKIKLAGDGNGFVCPCHASNFTLDGSRVKAISPRGMDTLEVAPIDPNDPNAEVRVKFQRFRTGTEEKIPLA
ncbi:QcrA and Rieske domain-containing protein [Tautonia sociabilis]|uniref:Rieske (2Fe-2S) protein n=1 Tax=Tautonia sociabilis TaxID=2080755 RepID=A0A432MND4_9BACT|nr:Rieske (2Fe-2S) protein [Tautonia sociabilis]RUL88951.1 Rieske (2Fe-2S) protein [Tautonia sociabilis]